MFRQTLDQRRHERPRYTNDDLRSMAEAGDLSAVEILKQRERRYSAAANMNRDNMRNK